MAVSPESSAHQFAEDNDIDEELHQWPDKDPERTQERTGKAFLQILPAQGDGKKEKVFHDVQTSLKSSICLRADSAQLNWAALCRPLC